MIENRYNEHLSAHDFPAEFIDSDVFMENILEYNKEVRVTGKDKDFN